VNKKKLASLLGIEYVYIVRSTRTEDLPMKATVYYIELTEAQRGRLNHLGWDSTIGKAYLAARKGRIDATNFDLLVKAATMEFADSAEHVWTALQNREEEWTTLDFITCHTTFPRSMDIGDIIVWENGSRQRCATVGFDQVHGVWED